MRKEDFDRLKTGNVIEYEDADGRKQVTIAARTYQGRKLICVYGSWFGFEDLDGSEEVVNWTETEEKPLNQDERKSAIEFVRSMRNMLDEFASSFLTAHDFEGINTDFELIEKAVDSILERLRGKKE